jgi:hypothetical protein
MSRPVYRVVRGVTLEEFADHLRACKVDFEILPDPEPILVTFPFLVIQGTEPKTLVVLDERNRQAYLDDLRRATFETWAMPPKPEPPKPPKLPGIAASLNLIDSETS